LPTRAPLKALGERFVDPQFGRNVNAFIQHLPADLEARAAIGLFGQPVQNPARQLLIVLTVESQSVGENSHRQRRCLLIQNQIPSR
jgi:hypothetical protein